MAVVLATTLKIGQKDGKVKIVEEGTPFEDLTKAEKELAKESNLLRQVADEVSLEEEIEETETEDSEDEDEDE